MGAAVAAVGSAYSNREDHPLHDDGGAPQAFRRHEIVERGGVERRTQPWETGVPRPGWSEPWMLWPRVVKKIACGMPALSHSCE